MSYATQAEEVADSFWDWVADSEEGSPEGTDSLLFALYWWVITRQAFSDTYGDVELYLQAVAIIIHQWHTKEDPRATGMETFESDRAPGWRVLDAATYRKHLRSLTSGDRRELGFTSSV